MKILSEIKSGFKNVNVDSKYKENALKFIELWLTDPQFADYIPQIEYLVEQQNWDTLLDCFYQIIPFGTGGRRGEVGIGPNKINPYTIMASAQGHSQYLIKKFGEDAKKRGIIISYDVRIYTQTEIYDNTRKNPINKLDCKSLAEIATEVYTANGINTYLFKTYTSTPEMSFMVKHKNAVAGDMISASHNPPEFNGIKVVNDFGGQLIPPHDQELVDIVQYQTQTIKRISLQKAKKSGLLHYITEKEHQCYIDSTAQLSINKTRGAKIYFSSLNGTSISSCLPVLQKLGHNVKADPQTSIPDGTFKYIRYNIPNPEVEQSFLGLIEGANKFGADIIVNADPDGDRIGLMSKENEKWRFYTGNQIYILCITYILDTLQKSKKLRSSNIILKTVVTTNLITAIAKAYNVQIEGEFMVGMKYIGNFMNELNKAGRNNDFIFGGEESHGSTAFSHINEKDTSVPAIYIAELTSILKKNKKTLGNYLDEIYQKYGYFLNIQNEIRLPGAEGMSLINTIQKKLRNKKKNLSNKIKFISFKDYWEDHPIVSESDRQSRNVLRYELDTNGTNANTINITVRPSGTEPKTKIYFEIGMKPSENLENSKNEAVNIGKAIEKAVIKELYRLIGIDFPDRAFLLFRMLPTNAKLKYFEIEKDIETLKDVKNQVERENKLYDLLKFLGTDPIEKVDEAFKEKYKSGIKKYLNLK